jgi:LPXTG-motif cell wall-anchored protein
MKNKTLLIIAGILMLSVGYWFFFVKNKKTENTDKNDNSKKDKKKDDNPIDNTSTQ